ncbi:MAG: hypothetical protein QOE35_316 [Actinomycetota bacterium]
MSGAPIISVVIPSYNRVGRLAGLTDALAAQDIDAPFEVLVIDNGSADDTPAELRRLEAVHPFLRSIRVDPNRGPGPARNAGWRAARADRVAFTDDDCVAAPSWLRLLVDGLDRADVVQGRTMPDQANLRQIGPFGHTIQVERESGLYQTCNIAYRKDVLESLGGLDERFGHFGDDCDLGWRAREAGYRSTFVDDALVVHEVVPSDFLRYLRGVPRIEGTVRALSRHSGMRDHFVRGRFYTEAHPPALALAGAGVALLGRPRSALRWAALLTAGTFYARAAMHVRPPPRRRRAWAWVLPLAACADMAEIAVLARASVRYRTLLL